jgi:hypothetical protein
MFRKTIKMRPLNLDVVVENVDCEEEDDGGEKNNAIEEQEWTRLVCERRAESGERRAESVDLESRERR